MTVIDISTNDRLFIGTKDQCNWWAHYNNFKVIDVDKLSKTVWVRPI